MQIIRYGNGPGARCYLRAQARYLRVGSGYLPRSRQSFVGIEVSYGLEELLPLSALFAAMDKRAAVPEVFVWDEEKIEPELLVLFRVSRPDAKLLETIAGRVGRMLIGCTEIIATGEANIERESMRGFLRRFKENGGGIVSVTDSMATSDDDLDPVHLFMVTRVERRRPTILA